MKKENKELEFYKKITNRRITNLVHSFAFLIKDLESIKVMEKEVSMEEMIKLLSTAQKRMDMLIHLTPTSPLRNTLVDENIELMTILNKLTSTPI